MDSGPLRGQEQCRKPERWKGPSGSKVARAARGPGEANGRDSEEEGLCEGQSGRSKGPGVQPGFIGHSPAHLVYSWPYLQTGSAGTCFPLTCWAQQFQALPRPPWLVNLMVWELPTCGSNGVSTSGRESLPPHPPPPHHHHQSSKGPPSGSAGVSSAQTGKHALRNRHRDSRVTASSGTVEAGLPPLRGPRDWSPRQTRMRREGSVDTALSAQRLRRGGAETGRRWDTGSLSSIPQTPPQDSCRSLRP